MSVSRHTQTLLDVLFLTLLFLITIKLFASIELIFDLPVNDEASYIMFGVKSRSEVGLPLSAGRLYGAWYRFVADYIPDMVELYYFSFRATALAFVCLNFLYLRRLGVTIIGAYLLAILFLTGVCLAPVHTRIGFFSSSLVMAGLWLSTFFRSFSLRLLVVALFSWCASFAHSEFYLSFLLYSILFLTSLVVFRKDSEPKERIICGTLLVVLLMAGLFFGLQPLFEPLDHAFFSFKQLFAVGFAERHGFPAEPG